MHQTVDASTFGCGIFCEPRVERVDPNALVGSETSEARWGQRAPPLRSFVSAIFPLDVTGAADLFARVEHLGET